MVLNVTQMEEEVDFALTIVSKLLYYRKKSKLVKRDNSYLNMATQNP